MYAKVFEQMYDGTLATKGPWQAVVTFQQFLILADKHGVVDRTPEVISKRTTIPLEIIHAGIEALEQPDPDSRTPVEGGRRIVRLSDTRSWGWRIVNYAKYRAIRSQEERREYHSAYWRAKRSPNAKVDTQQTQQDSTNSTNSSKHKQNAGSSKPKASIGKRNPEDAEFIAALDGPAPFEPQPVASSKEVPAHA
ncbi:MAG: hypothetical protein HYY78_12125 [Betaproteobacteria bacterium]|nr:hypothetical protein [Betaproteobacteria bacterium]